MMCPGVGKVLTAIHLMVSVADDFLSASTIPFVGPLLQGPPSSESLLARDDDNGAGSEDIVRIVPAGRAEASGQDSVR